MKKNVFQLALSLSGGQLTVTGGQWVMYATLAVLTFIITYLITCLPQILILIQQSN